MRFYVSARRILSFIPCFHSLLHNQTIGSVEFYARNLKFEIGDVGLYPRRNYVHRATLHSFEGIA
ncbi:MAG TPA: hypothetical protein VMW39_00255 [bacterium]|nr:hypothetical protein [bacterium]